MFGTSGIRGEVGTDVTAALALDVARALAADTDRVVVGRDARDSGRALVTAVTAGLLECGVDVVDVGMASTPTIARAIADRDADAGIAITASHNPPTDNGIKLWTPSGQAFDAAARERVERRIAADDPPCAAWDAHGKRERWDGAIAAHCRDLAAVGRRRASEADGDADGDASEADGDADGDASDPDGDAGVDLSHLHVVVDVGNGMGGVTADALYELGATVETLNSHPDGRFPARPSEPTPETCAGLVDHVAARDADLGVAHDGDADRMLAVDGDGTFVSGDELLAVFALATATAGDRIAAPVDTSLAVDDALEAIDAGVMRTQVGDVYVAEATRKDGVVFGGEPSGAWIFPAETRCPDGPLAAVVLAVLAAECPLSDRVDALPSYPIRRDTVETGRKAAVMDAITDRVRETHGDVTEIDGVRVGLDEGWFLIRASGTQPLVRITAEAREADAVEEIRASAREIVETAITETTE